MNQVQNNHHYQQQSPTKMQRVTTGCCFRCHKPGHWAKDCPDNPANRSPVSPSTPTTTSDPEFSSHHCRCGGGLCPIRVAGPQSKNPGRKYYSCPSKSWMKCDYFKWCDMLKKEDIQESKPESFPMCGCGAEISRLMIEKNGPNAGKRYLACFIEKGEGACNFKQWLDSTPESALNISEDMVAECNGVLGEFELSIEEAMQVDALETSASAYKNHLEEVQVQMESPELPLEEVEVQMESPVHTLEEVQLQMGDSETNETGEGAGETTAESTEVNPPSLVNNVSGYTLDSELTNQNSVILQKNMDKSAIDNNVQASFTALVTTLGNPLLKDVVLKYLEACLVQDPGWLGQIAYASRHVSISAVSSYPSRGSFPHFNPDIIQKENASVPSVILEDSSKEGLSPSLNEPWARPVVNPSFLLKDGRDNGSIMTGTILQAFEELACRFQNDLIALLESMGPQCHEMMQKETDSTFAALDRLQVDYEVFRLRVTEYITHAAAVAQIEQTISNDASSHELLKRYKMEKSHFDEIFLAYCEAKATYMASSERLSLLRENASCLRDMLIELETEISCCEVENAVHRDSLLQISNTMSECKKNLLAASREAAEALKQSEKREIERSAAKAAFERARAQLRR